MIEGKRVLALIPARGGSKGIKNKNIIDLCGKPLIAYTIEAAKCCQYIDDVVVSTDSIDIANVARACGAEVPFIRPEELASDTAKSIDAVIHAIDTLKTMGRKYDLMVLLQATSPLRNSDDISGAIVKFIQCGMKSLVGISEVDESPVLIRKVIDDMCMDKLIAANSTVRRQDMKAFYKVNGSIYINAIEEISSSTSFNDNIIPYIIDKSHGIDIDEYVDLEMAKYYLNK